jgi:hypothetical protein
MSIYITFDYELFFGNDTGSVDNCIIKPTQKLIQIANKHNVKLVFFVDSGYILKLDECRKKYPILEVDYQKIISQIKYLSDSGHDIQLHIHSHWEDSYFDGKKWIIDTSRYRLHQFTSAMIDSIVYRYKKVLTDIIGDRVFAFRAGGWCIQPFNKITDALKKHNIWLDSTVFFGGINKSKTHYFNFKNAPKKTQWVFDRDPLVEDIDGFFTEKPIASKIVSPLFFWKFAITKKLYTKKHKTFGDGVPVGIKKIDIVKKLVFPSYMAASFDGYKSNLIHKYNITDEFVIISHPKALSEFSLHNIDIFIQNNKKYITTFSDCR